MKIEQRCKVHEQDRFSAYDIDIEKWVSEKPFGISGCFRLKNESQFMKASVMSHIEWLDEAVLVVQHSDDDTVTKAVAMANSMPDKIRVEVYPFDVFPIGTPGHHNSPENSVYTMMHLTNWALSRCRYSWIAKTEGDVVGLKTFAKIRQAIESNPNDFLYYGRVGLNVAMPSGNFFPREAPRNAGWDEAVFNNNPFWHCVKNDKWESLNLHQHKDKLVNMGWSFIHTKRMKKSVQKSIHETWPTLNKLNLVEALEEYNLRHGYPGPDNPLGVDELLDEKWKEWLK